ncbi:hypothetical protein M3J09_006628 [Ascochyta lentis]
MRSRRYTSTWALVCFRFSRDSSESKAFAYQKIFGGS